MREKRRVGEWERARVGKWGNGRVEECVYRVEISVEKDMTE